MIKIRALTKKLSNGLDGSQSQKKRSVSDYDRKHSSSKLTRSSMRRRAISSTREINTELPPLPNQEFTISANTDSPKDGPFAAKTQGCFYIYDSSIFREPKEGESAIDPEFHIFQKPNGVNPKSAREVIHALVEQFKSTLLRDPKGDGEKNITNIKSAMEIFKPNLSHYVPQEIKETTQVLESLFPRDGCSLVGDALAAEIENNLAHSKSKIILSLRIIWSKLPRGIIPWESYLKFCTVESKQNYSKMCFMNFMPQALPDSDYLCCAFDFMKLLVAIISKVDLVVDKVAQIDLIFTAAQVCFRKTPELMNYIDYKSEYNGDSIALAKLYRARGDALYRLFISYLNSLAEEGEIKDFYLIDNFRIHEYPPKPYKPMTQRALTLSIPQLWNPDINNFNELIRVAAKAQSRSYSSDQTFSKLENSFLDKFEENPYKIVSTLFSRSSKRYLDKFDPAFDAEYFKKFTKKGGFNSTLGPADQQPVATWINSCKERGFNDFLSVLDDNNHGEGTLALGFSFPNSTHDEINLPPLRVSKVDISEYFISSWKYETFLGKVHNTLVIKMTKRVGDCEWLVISMDERTDKTGYSPPNKVDQPACMDTPPLPSKNVSQFHTASPSMSSVKSRPPPPSLFGEPSSSPLLDPASGVFSDQSSAVVSSRSSSDTNSFYVHGRPHSTAVSPDVKKDADKHVWNISLQDRSRRQSKAANSPHTGILTSTSPLATHESKDEGVNLESLTITEDVAEEGLDPNMAEAKDAGSGSEGNPMPNEGNETDNAGVTTLERLADTFKIDRQRGCSGDHDESGEHSGSQTAAETDTLGTSDETNISNEKENASKTSVVEASRSTSLRLPKFVAQQEGEAVSTPINQCSPAGVPLMLAKIQNPSVASLGDTTAVGQNADTTVDTVDTTRVSDEDAQDKVIGSDIPHDSKVLEALYQRKADQDELTEDLLNDFLEHYQTLSREPLDSSDDGPTVFEQVKGYFESGKGTSPPQPLGEQEAGNKSEATQANDKSVSDLSKIGSITSKNGTWFSCNVTPPNRVSEKVKKPMSLKSTTPIKPASDYSGYNSFKSGSVADYETRYEDDDDDDDLDDELYRSATSNTSDMPEQDGVWLEATTSNPSSPSESTPTQMMFRNVMMRTKRSLRNLKAGY
ncbi:LADA_0B05842g1_1 [Lachancea dasiensis]|uniref:LADA_0B05842g1_1 n=1 Tax=Lachancea dasiensis TaxID=1072105 RepID=A0A1G4ITP6_9SACH|nr:LADA_0B05842g1_1 [Lachancea dasiensis]